VSSFNFVLNLLNKEYKNFIEAVVSLLYISRILPGDNYGVYDTDDDTEQYVSLTKLQHIVCNLGVEIKGVSVDPEVDYLLNITVYNGNCTGETAKRALLDGIDIVVTAGEIVAINFTPYVRESYLPIRVCVSRYAKRLSGLAQYKCWNFNTRLAFILEMDESVQVSLGMANVKSPGVMYDIRRLSDSHPFVTNLYYYLIKNRWKDYDRWNMTVQDNPERFNLWMIVDAMCDGGDVTSRIGSYMNLRTERGRYIGVLNKALLPIFNKYADYGGESEIYECEDLFDPYCELKGDRLDIVLERDSVEEYVRVVMWYIDSFYGRYPVNMPVLHLLTNFYRYFGLSPENERVVKDLFRKVTENILDMMYGAR